MRFLQSLCLSVGHFLWSTATDIHTHIHSHSHAIHLHLYFLAFTAIHHRNCLCVSVCSICNLNDLHRLTFTLNKSALSWGTRVSAHPFGIPLSPPPLLLFRSLSLSLSLLPSQSECRVWLVTLGALTSKSTHLHPLCLTLSREKKQLPKIRQKSPATCALICSSLDQSIVCSFPHSVHTDLCARLSYTCGHSCISVKIHS